MITPRRLSDSQFKGLQKLGDCLIPGDHELPAFSKSGAGAEADRILDYMSEGDLKDLQMLLGLFSIMPRVFVAGVVRFLEITAKLPGPIGGLLRFMRLGIRGLVMTLYYSHPAIQKAIGFEVKVFTADMPSPSANTGSASTGSARKTPQSAELLSSGPGAFQ